jgi:hypothetical protein
MADASINRRADMPDLKFAFPDSRRVTKVAAELEKLLNDNDPEGFGCACVPDKWLCGPCTAREAQKPFRDMLATLRGSAGTSGVPVPVDATFQKKTPE